jgi:hypothetical protein
MSISRRIFLKVSTIAAVAAGMSLKPSVSILGQDPPSDPLSNYTMATFAQYVDSVFSIRGSTSVEVTLTEVKNTLPANESGSGRECFVLHFRGGSTALRQKTYTIEHAALGTFSLFVVPGGPDANGAQGYTATINRR